MKKRNLPFYLIILLSMTIAQSGYAQNIGEPGREEGKANPLKNVYFGEQHIHTGNSPDAFTLGGRSTWDDVYNYAQGKEIKLSTTGKVIQKKTPYDFVGITDHSEYFAVMPALHTISTNYSTAVI